MFGGFVDIFLLSFFDWKVEDVFRSSV